MFIHLVILEKKPFYILKGAKDLNRSDYFLREVPERQFVKTIHRQERTSSEEKSDRFH